MPHDAYALARRRFLIGSASGLTVSAATPVLGKARGPLDIEARAAKQTLHSSLPPSDLWTYDGQAPGRTIRVNQGDAVDIRLTNKLKEATSIHWHGVRTANAMDGVPYLTQDPVEAGGRFRYRFRADDAGTFFYHPHINSVQQVGSGMFGALIVDETRKPAVDRDVTWVLNDWRIGRDDRLVGAFNHPHDQSHAGRIGNLVTINGAHDPVLRGRVHQRLRLRLINAATGRIFKPDFGAVKPWVIAFDGQPITPRPATASDLVLGPGMRLDLMIDLPDSAGKTLAITDRYDSDRPYRLARVGIEAGKPERPKPLGPPRALADNPIARFDPSKATRKEVIFAGGAMGGMMGGMMGDRGRRGMMAMRRHRGMMMSRGLFWIVNDRLIPALGAGQSAAPLFRLTRNKHYLVRMENHTAFDHPIHLHGHTFQVLSRNGVALKQRELRDTVMMAPREKVEIGFVADNPGKWMFHCHILSHVSAGMGGVVEVA